MQGWEYITTSHFGFNFSFSELGSITNSLWHWLHQPLALKCTGTFATPDLFLLVRGIGLVPKVTDWTNMDTKVANCRSILIHAGWAVNTLDNSYPRRDPTSCYSNYIYSVWSIKILHIFTIFYKIYTYITKINELLTLKRCFKYSM